MMSWLILSVLLHYNSQVQSTEPHSDVTQTMHGATLATVPHDATHDGQHTTAIVIIGATGSLAKKYLWQAVYDVTAKHNTVFRIYGASRTEHNTGQKRLQDVLQESILSSSGKKKFIDSVEFVQLNTSHHYKAFCDLLNLNKHITGRNFYLSISSSSYVNTARLLHEYCHTTDTSGPWSRLVVEKPFGHDLESAKVMVDELQHYFREEDTYRIDHYLGKPIVQEILPFRLANRATYEAVWNNNYIERVEIFLKESEDVKGRLEFYSKTGVIRDVFQNHLMELLLMVSMELPDIDNNHNNIQSNKMIVMNSMDVIKQQILLGQYDTFCDEYKNLFNRTCDVTPTFAVVVFNINNDRWRNVPFFLISGKKMDTKESLIRIQLKGLTKSEEIIFDLHRGIIMTSKSLPVPSDWLSVKLKCNQRSSLDTSHLKHYWLLEPTSVQGAYNVLLESIINNQRHLFIDREHLLKSWNIWSHVLNFVKTIKPKIYRGAYQSNMDLDFLYNHESKELQFKKIKQNAMREGLIHQNNILGLNSCSIIVNTTRNVIARLAEDILSHCKHAVTLRRQFHIAMSVSSGTMPILQFILDNYKYSYILQPYTHIWMVDELCVAKNNSHFFKLNEHLLSHIRLPYYNIHPMPASLYTGFCNDSNSLQYGAKLKKLTGNSLDFILLDDSLLSLYDTLPTTVNNVMCHNGRMMMTLPLVMQSKYIAVLQSKDYYYKTVYFTRANVSWYIDIG